MMDFMAMVAPWALGVVDGQGPVTWSERFWANVWDPWFLFGMAAQGTFFLRFFVQWIASERKKRSTVPVAFWYLSLVGGLATFVYASHRADPVIMAGQLLACFIYVRNLMLISSHRQRVQSQKGQPLGEVELDEEADKA